MSSENTDQEIIETVQNHYRDHDSPYYLSELGALFHLRNIDVPLGLRFKDYLAGRFHGTLVVVQDAETPAKIAIAPIEKEEIVRQQLSGVGSSRTDDSTIEYPRLPLALIAAFCKDPLPGERIYFRTAEPFRYETRVESPAGNYVEIDEQFRPRSLAGKSVHQLSPSEKQTIYSCIDAWAAMKSINVRNFYHDRRVGSAGQAGAVSGGMNNALQRLIDAQEPGMKARIRIPGDIVSTLMRLP